MADSLLLYPLYPVDEFVDWLPPSISWDVAVPEGTRFRLSIVEFTDAAGRVWIRSADGDLHRGQRLGQDASATVITIDGTTGLVADIAMYPHPAGRPRQLVRHDPLDHDKHGRLHNWWTALRGRDLSRWRQLGDNEPTNPTPE